MQAIFERAIEEGHDFRKPFRGIKRGKDKPRTRVLSLDEETKLMDARHPRFQRFVRFALGTGARLEEIRGVDPDRDVNWHDGTVHVLGKFKKEHDIPMQPDAQAARRFRASLHTPCATPSGRAGCRRAVISTSSRRSSATPPWP